MKRTRWWMSGAVVVLTAALVGATIKARQAPLYRLSRYSRTSEFNNYLNLIRSELKTPTDGRLVTIHEPARGDFKRVLGYTVNESQQPLLFTLSFDGLPGGTVIGRGAYTNAGQIARIRKLVQQLPPSAPPDEREDLIVVLLHGVPNARLRLYDRRHPPAQIREIVSLLTQIVEDEYRRFPAGSLPAGSLPPNDLPHMTSDLRPSNSQRAIN